MIEQSRIDRLKMDWDLLTNVMALADIKPTHGWWIGPCPLCGGTDRFNMKQTAQGWRWLCRKCTGGKYHDSIEMMMKLWNVSFQAAVERMDGGSKISEEESLRLAIRRAEAAKQQLEAQIALANEKLADLRSAAAWVKWHDSMDEIGRDLWAARGITDQFWQDWWQLGVDPMHDFYIKGKGKWQSPTLTIPVFGLGWDIRQVKHRLLAPPTEHDRYRPEMADLPPAPFIGDPDQESISGRAVLVEGEIKAMVTMQTLADETTAVIGLPGKSTISTALPVLKDADPVIFVPDPDMADDEIKGVVDQIGASRTRIVKLPEKIDDAIIEFNLDRQWLRNVLNTAWRI